MRTAGMIGVVPEAATQRVTVTVGLEGFRALLTMCEHYRQALEGIAANTCCGPCREAAVVAGAALAGDRAEHWLDPPYAIGAAGFTRVVFARTEAEVFAAIEDMMSGRFGERASSVTITRPNVADTEEPEGTPADFSSGIAP